MTVESRAYPVWGATYGVSATVDGVQLGTPITLSGNAIVVLEPNSLSSMASSPSAQSSSSAQLASTASSSSQGTGAPAGSIPIYLLGALAVGVAAIAAAASYIGLRSRRVG
ncbi:MAG: hypothetical protein JRN09_05160 [Nitrososphaerota archaeon]|nr:hypothetical protein [Nitrososphaerota archaeon]